MARQTLEKSIKFKGLIRALGIPRPCVRGLLETMWDVAHECGNPKLGTPEQVETAAEWYGEPGVLFAALKNLDWIDEIEGAPGRWEIHDYWDHAPKSAAGRAQREAEREMKGTTLSELRREAGRLGGLAKAGKSLATGSNLPEDRSNRKQTPSKISHSRHPTPDTHTQNLSCSPKSPANGREGGDDDGFATWYDAYPRKQAKARAEKEWRATKAKRPPLAAMIATLEAQKASDEWNREDGRFVPLPDAYLKAGRWADQVAIYVPPANSEPLGRPAAEMPLLSALGAPRREYWVTAVASLGLGSEEYETWFRPLGVEWNGNGVHVYAPNDRFRASFEEHYSAALAENLGEAVHVEVW